MAEDGTTSVIVKLPSEYHSQLKAQSKSQGETITKVASDVIVEYLQKQSQDVNDNVPQNDSALIKAIYDKVKDIDSGDLVTPSRVKGNRVMIFLDVRNVTSLDKTAKINFRKMIDYLVRGRDVVAQYAYDSVRYGADGTDIATRFHDYLRISGFELKLRDSTHEETQKEVDVALASDMQYQASRNNYDVAILISGDRDFVPAIEIIRAMGKRVEVASFDDCLSHVLQTKANKAYALDDLFIIQMMDPETAAKYEHKEVGA